MPNVTKPTKNRKVGQGQQPPWDGEWGGWTVPISVNVANKSMPV